MMNVDRHRFWISIVFGIALISLLVRAFFAVREPSNFQRQVARVFTALAAGLIAYLLSGELKVQGPFMGFSVTAAGGLAVFFIIMFVYDPFPKVEPSPQRPSYIGETLGGLVDHIEKAFAAGETDEGILLEAGRRNELHNFELSGREWVGPTWTKIAQRICEVHTCLECILSRDSKTVRIQLRGPLQERCVDANCKQRRYSCRG
jgi:hypothetical protein